MTAYLALGSNLGDKVGHLRAAVTAIAAFPMTRRDGALGCFTGRRPWGKTDQDWFVNAVIAVETTLSPETCCRKRWPSSSNWAGASGTLGPRVIDIDLLLHGDAQRQRQALPCRIRP